MAFAPDSEIPIIDEDLETLRDQNALEPLDMESVKAIVESEIQDALGGMNSEISEDRRKAIQHYYDNSTNDSQCGDEFIVPTMIGRSPD